MKVAVAILFSLAMVLAHLPGFAASARQLCKSEAPCGCGDSTCCVSEAGSQPAPLNPVPSSDSSRTQLLVVFQSVALPRVAQPASPPAFSRLPASPASAAVPLYVRNCSFLI